MIIGMKMMGIVARGSRNGVKRMIGIDAERKRATTILAVKKNNQTFLIGDGQVSQGSAIVKANARKVRILKEGIVCGFAGGAADAIALMELLEKEIDKYAGFSLLKPCTELAKQWRSNKMLRELKATILVADKEHIIELDGEGNVFEITGIRGIGSGGLFAECAAEALFDMPLSAKEIGEKAMKIAASKCVYTNDSFISHLLDAQNTPVPPKDDPLTTKETKTPN